jgi:hypothetical protein
VRKNRKYLTQVFVVVVPGNRWQGAEVVVPFCWNQRREIAKFTGCGAIQRAQHWQQILDETPWLTKLQIAENEGINRTSVYLHLGLLKLQQEILDIICELKEPADQNYFTERRLRPLLSLCREEQLRQFERICSRWRESRARSERKKSCRT